MTQGPSVAPAFLLLLHTNLNIGLSRMDQKLVRRSPHWYKVSWRQYYGHGRKICGFKHEPCA